MAKGGRKGSSGAAKNASAAAAKLQEDVWAQCDNPNCQKWRRLPPRTIIDENTPWYCYMNPDEDKAACEAPEESYTLDVELEPGCEARTASASTHSAGKSKGSSHADRSRSSTRSHQQQWHGTQRSLSGSSSQGTKRRADSDAFDPPYESKRARASTPPALRSQSQAEADSGGVPGSDLHGSSSGGLRHSLRPKRPPSYPLKEESPPPQAPPRQHHSGPRQGQGSSRTSSGQSQKAQAAATRPTQKARKQHKGFEKLLTLGGLWEIVKGKGKAITPAPFWVWEGLATHTPAAAELAAQAADVASAARYFDGSNYPSGAAQASEAASLKRQAMAAAAVIGLDATSQIPDVIAPAPSRSTPSAAAVAVKPQEAVTQSHTLSQAPSEAPRQLNHLPQAAGQSAELHSTQLPTHSRAQSLSQILAQTQSLPQSQLQPQLQPDPQPQLQSPPPQSSSHLETQLHSQLPSLVHTQPQLQLQSSLQMQSVPAMQQQQLQAQQQQVQLQPQALQLQQQLHQLPQHSSALQPHLQQILARQAAAATSLAHPELQQQNRTSQLPSHLATFNSGAELADWPQLQQEGQTQSGSAVSSQQTLLPVGVVQTAPHQPQPQAVSLQAQDAPKEIHSQRTEPQNQVADLEPAGMQSCNGMQSVPLLKPQASGLQNGKSHHAHHTEFGQLHQEAC